MAQSEVVPNDGQVVPLNLPRMLMGQLERQANTREYTGTLSDYDAKALVSRSYNTTKEEASAVDRIVQSPLTAYVSSGDFVRHAVWELLNAWEQAGFPDDYNADLLAHVRAMRDQADRLKLRQQFAEVLTGYEASIIAGLETGDLEFIEYNLGVLQGYVDRTPEVHWKNYLRKVIIRSGVIKSALEALHEAVEEGGQGQFAVSVEHWQLWAEGIQE